MPTTGTEPAAATAGPAEISLKELLNRLLAIDTGQLCAHMALRPCAALELPARAANAKIIGNPQLRDNFNSTLGASSHHTGGAIMGADPKTSVLNRYLQSWDVSNLFVMGGAAFPQNAGHNPTGTIAALTYWSARAITSQYIKSPGPLVRA